MSKRNFSVLSQDDPNGSATNPKRKKADPNDAIAELLKHSGELLKCVEALKQTTAVSSLADLDPSVRGRLAAVSKQLLPSVQILASEPGSAECDEGDATEQEAGSTSKVPTFTSLTPWSSADVAQSLPALPAIDNPVIESAAFTHPAAVPAGSLDAQHQSWDRLEWLGDAYLELIASNLIYRTFPDLPHGKATQIRELLIRNETLARYSRDYGLDKRAVLPPEYFDHGGRGIKVTHKEGVKVLGDIFEAYVGAIIVADPRQGVSRVSTWLKSIWAKTIGDKIVAEEKRRQPPDLTAPGTGGHVVTGQPAAKPQAPPPAPPKVLLSQKIVVPGVTLRYEDLPPPRRKDKDHHLPLFAIGVFMDGWGVNRLLLGSGTALGKKEAGQKAAQTALENKKLMQLYGGKKDAFMAASGLQ